MPRTAELYAAVMSSPLMNEAMRQIYWLFSSYPEGQELTKGEVEKILEKDCSVARIPEQPWVKQVPVMVKMKLLEKGNKRHCSVKNKEDATWKLTDKPPVRPRVNKPGFKRYHQGLAAWETLMAYHKQRGDDLVTPDMELLHAWVRDKAPEKSQKPAG